MNAVAGRADGTALFTAGDDGLVIQWNLATGEQISYVPRGQAHPPKTWPAATDLTHWSASARGH